MTRRNGLIDEYVGYCSDDAPMKSTDTYQNRLGASEMLLVHLAPAQACARTALVHLQFGFRTSARDRTGVVVSTIIGSLLASERQEHCIKMALRCFVGWSVALRFHCLHNVANPRLLYHVLPFRHVLALASNGILKNAFQVFRA